MTKDRARIMPNEWGKEGYVIQKWVGNTGNFISLDKEELFGLLKDIEGILYSDEEGSDGKSNQTESL